MATAQTENKLASKTSRVGKKPVVAPKGVTVTLAGETLKAKGPLGELEVKVVVHDPNYTFDPEVFPESAEARQLGRKLILPPGPNNPVGVAWVGLDKPGYGIHGTPVHEQVGRTESHGCFRLANWNAEYLLKLVTCLPLPATEAEFFEARFSFFCCLLGSRRAR